MEMPFERTTCDCAACSAHCRVRPGYALLEDVLRASAELVAAGDAEPLARFEASKGPVVSAGGAPFRIGTITPKLTPAGCTFLEADGRCGVHAVAPFGCSHFDAHMPEAEATRRSSWALRRIAGDPVYARLRAELEARDGGAREPFAR